MSIGYKKVQVSKEKLSRLKLEMDNAPRSQKYGRFKAWLHFANLDMWQAQGHHFHYLTEVGNEVVEQPAALVTVTVIVALEVTLIEDVVAPLDHK